MLISKYTVIVVAAVSLLCGSSPALGKGLDNLQPSTPPAEAVKEAEGAAKAATPDAEKAVEPEAKKVEPSKTSKALADKLFFSTSYGWVIASKSEGTWKSSGMSDFSVGYLLPVSLGKAKLFGTYRYAPIGVSGEIDGYSYRGVWEAHNFGAKGYFGLSETLFVTGMAELGYVLAYMDSLDSKPQLDKHSENGVIVNVGGSVEWALSPKLSVGPKLIAGFGGFTVIQVGGGVRFVF